MKHLKFHSTEPASGNLFVAILFWYLIGAISILFFLAMLQLWGG